MKQRKFILICALMVTGVKANAQVNMTQGTMSFTVPIYSYADNLSGLALQTELAYNSGNGLRVDDVASCVGTGWELTGVPVVSRMVRGLPDDQLEKSGNIYDTTKYPPGYLYNNLNISLGCPRALNKYPIFHSRGVWYDDDNRSLADRELDNFQVLLNGRMATFVIGKNMSAVLLDDSRLKIDIVTEDQRQSGHIRTSIKEFDITDENGIKYIFSELQVSRLFKTGQPFGGIFSYESEIPLNQDPFVITGWYLSKIIDPKTSRFISFSYNTVAYKYQSFADLKTEICVQTTPSTCGGIIVVITDPANTTYTLDTKTTGFIRNTDIQKKEVSSINFPNGFNLNFSYSATRKDIPGTSLLNAISISTATQQSILTYNLDHSYFVKNEIKIPANSQEGRWSRLCLTAIRKTSVSGTTSENPWRFEYYQGSNATEDFVAPYFFQARDPWGYYNGSYAGVPTDRFLSTAYLPTDDYPFWSKVSLYNQGHGYYGGAEIYYNAKTNYARNGLLKKIINPFGGATEYQYEQNYFATTWNSEIYSFDHLPNADMAVGGVHLSKIIQQPDNNPVNNIITEYNYTDDQGRSTRWGEEPLRYTTKQKTFWQAADKYFTGGNCNYYYIYPGNSLATSVAKDRLFSYINIAYYQYRYLKYLFDKYEKPEDALTVYIISLIRNYVLSLLIECLTLDAPSQSESHDVIMSHNTNENLLPCRYKRVSVKVYSGNNLQSGKTVYEFTSPDDFPLILPNESAGFENKPRAYNWMYGLNKTVKYYDNASSLVKSTENEYGLRKNDVVDANTSSCNCQSYYQESLRSDQWNTAATFNDFTTTNITNAGFTRLKVDFYNLVTGHSELKRSTEKIFNHSGQALTSVVNYNYNPVNNLPASQTSVNSKGTVVDSKTYYLEDYDLNVPANSVLKQMKNDHVLNVPISSETWQTKPGGSPEMLGCSATEYGISPSGSYRPIKTYSFQTDKPLPENVIGQFNPSMLVRNNNYIKPVKQTAYDLYFGEPIQTTDIEGTRTSSVIFGTTERLPIASITNAARNEVAYSSFELDEGWYTGSWSNVNAQILKEPSPTGDYCLRLSNGSSSTAYIPILKDYKLSFWASSSSFNISSNPVPKIVGPSISGWTYYEFDLPPWSPYLTITGNCKIDELRLYPKDANMSTTTYRPGIGKTSECDINNRISYFEYDEFGRISKLLDAYHNIIKTYEYHFKN